MDCLSTLVPLSLGSMWCSQILRRGERLGSRVFSDFWILWSWPIYRPVHNSRNGTTLKFS